jgi:hypothetical protein
MPGGGSPRIKLYRAGVGVSLIGAKKPEEQLMIYAPAFDDEEDS